MMTGPAKLAILAGVFLAAVMLVLGNAGRAEAHGPSHHPTNSAANSPAAAPDTKRATREAQGHGPTQAQMVLQETEGQTPASDRSNDAPCCGGAPCHAGVAAVNPEPSPLELTSAKLPLPRAYGSPSRLPSGIERPPRRPSTI